MSKVEDLQPGDLVWTEGLAMSGVFIARASHPEYEGLQLVIWKLDDGKFSFDALLLKQEIGQIQPSTARDKGLRLRKALGGEEKS